MRSVNVLLLIFYFAKGIYYYFVAAGFSLRMKISGVGILNNAHPKGCGYPKDVK